MVRLKKPPEPNGPTQKTDTGATIPVPTRKAVFDDLKKVAKPRKPDAPDPPPED